jgi:hypothetical protein
MRLARGIIVTLLLLAGAATAPQAAKADITFTWVSDSRDLEGGPTLSGGFTVQSAAQAAGQIALANVISYSFTTGQDLGLSTLNGLTYTGNSALDGAYFPLPISPTTAAPTESETFVTAPYSEPYGPWTLTIAFDLNWNQPFAESYTEVVNRDGAAVEYSGSGHWAITGQTLAPEPTSAMIAAFGGAAFIAYGLVRKRQGGGRHTITRLCVRMSTSVPVSSR